MSWLAAIFGPSKADVLATANDALVAILREDRAALAAERASVTALLSEFVDTTRIQAGVAKAQMDLWTRPMPTPEVRLMTSVHEAELERAREAASRLKPSATTMSPDSLLRDLAADFEMDRSRH
jgi:hypothetical protein